MDVLLEECPHSIQFDAFIEHLASGLAVRCAVLALRIRISCFRADALKVSSLCGAGGKFEPV